MITSTIVIGTLLILGGVSGLYFVTGPSIFGIGESVESVIEGEDVGKSVGNAIVSGIVIYFTTGLFIIFTVGGIVAFYFGVKK